MCSGAPWAGEVQRVPPPLQSASLPGLGSESSHCGSWGRVSWVMGGEPPSSQASSSPIPVPQHQAYLSLRHLAEPGLRGGAHGGGRADRVMPSGALEPNTCRKDQSPYWVTSALPLCPTSLELTVTPPCLPHLPHKPPRLSGGHKAVGSWLLFLLAAGGLYNVLPGD